MNQSTWTLVTYCDRTTDAPEVSKDYTSPQLLSVHTRTLSSPRNWNRLSAQLTDAQTIEEFRVGLWQHSRLTEDKEPPTFLPVSNQANLNVFTRERRLSHFPYAGQQYILFHET